MFNFSVKNFMKRLSLFSLGAVLIASTPAATATGCDSAYCEKNFLGQSVLVDINPTFLQISGSVGTGTFFVVVGGPSMAQSNFLLGATSEYQVTNGVISNSPTVTTASTTIGGVGTYALTFYVTVDPASEFGILGEVDVTVNGTTFVIPLNSPTFTTDRQTEVFAYSIPFSVG